MGRLDVRIVEARNLPNPEMLGGPKPDPYVKVELDNNTHKTSVASSTSTPKWDQVFKFVVTDPECAQLRIKVYSKGLVSDAFIGSYKMSLNGLFKGQAKDSWILLQQCKNNAEIHIRLLADDFGKDPASYAPVVANYSYYPTQDIPQQRMANEATALPVISGMDQLGDGTSADSSCKQAVDDYRATAAQTLGISGDEAVDGLMQYFAAHWVPMGMINKLSILQTFDRMVLVADDSFSMETDTGKKGFTRFIQMQARFYELLEICSFVKTPSISIYWLNNEEVYTLDRIVGEKPIDFQKRAREFLDRAFTAPKGSTPVIELLQKLFKEFEGKSVWYGLAFDGQPNFFAGTNKPTVPEIRRMIRERPNPERNPITFMSMTDDQRDVAWCKSCKAVAPYVGECDEYKRQEQECLSAQGNAFSYSYGLYLLCHLVGASDPDVLNALSEHPLTKASLSALQGYSLSDQQFDYYFENVLNAQHKLAEGLVMSSDTEKFIKYYYMMKFDACRNDFRNTAKVSELPVLQEYKAKLANAKNEDKRFYAEQVMPSIRAFRETAVKLKTLEAEEEACRRAIPPEENKKYSAIYKRFLNEGPGSGCCSIQ